MEKRMIYFLGTALVLGLMLTGCSGYYSGYVYDDYPYSYGYYDYPYYGHGYGYRYYSSPYRHYDRHHHEYGQSYQWSTPSAPQGGIGQQIPSQGGARHEGDHRGSGGHHGRGERERGERHHDRD